MVFSSSSTVSSTIVGVFSWAIFTLQHFQLFVFCAFQLRGDVATDKKTPKTRPKEILKFLSVDFGYFSRMKGIQKK